MSITDAQWLAGRRCSGLRVVSVSTASTAIFINGSS